VLCYPISAKQPQETMLERIVSADEDGELDDGEMDEAGMPDPDAEDGEILEDGEIASDQDGEIEYNEQGE